MEKNNNTIIYILVFIIGILIGIVGMMLIQKNNDYKKVPNEVRTKEKKETKSTSKDNKPGKVKDELLKGCIYSSQNGKHCKERNRKLWHINMMQVMLMVL